MKSGLEVDLEMNHGSAPDRPQGTPQMASYILPLCCLQVVLCDVIQHMLPIVGSIVRGQAGPQGRQGTIRVCVDKSNFDTPTWRHGDLWVDTIR